MKFLNASLLFILVTSCGSNQKQQFESELIGLWKRAPVDDFSSTLEDWVEFNSDYTFDFITDSGTVKLSGNCYTNNGLVNFRENDDSPKIYKFRYEIKEDTIIIRDLESRIKTKLIKHSK